MKVFRPLAKNALPLVVFFLLETFSKNEVLLLAAAAICTAWIFSHSLFRTKYILWGIGFALGLLVEVWMGFVARSQYWTYGSLFGVPLWLPFAWGLAFVAIHNLGRELRG